MGGTVLSFLWSLLGVSLCLYLYAGRGGAIGRTLAQAAGMGVMLWGLLRFLRRWFAFLGGAYARDMLNIRLTPSLGVRIRLTWRIISRMLRLSGLGWLLIGLGFTILARNVFPDPGISHDWALGRRGLVLIILGALQEWFSRDGQKE